MPETKNPLVSVILPVYNGQKHLKTAIQSILNQTYQHIELIIINDASTDSSQIIIEKFQSNKVRIFSHKKNLGLSAALNFAISKSRGCLIARMDQDDISSPKRIEHQVSYLQKKQLQLVGTWYENIDTQGKTTKAIKRIYKHQDLKKALLVDTYFCHGSILFTKSDYLKVGGYRSRFDYAEDYDFLSLFSQLPGIKLGNVPTILYQHRISPGGMSFSGRSRQLKVRQKISSRNISQFQSFYLPGYSYTSNSFVIKSQITISGRLTKVLFQKGIYLPGIIELINHIKLKYL